MKTGSATERNILIMEDESELAELLKLVLEGHGYHVEVASDGWEGLGKLKQKVYDLILLNLMMPSLDGLAVLDILGQVRGFKTPILIESSYEKPITHPVLGKYDYIRKPFDLEALPDIVQAKLAGAGRWRSRGGNVGKLWGPRIEKAIQAYCLGLESVQRKTRGPARSLEEMMRAVGKRKVEYSGD